MDETHDRYAGDEAWKKWFEICSVDGCPPEEARRLRAQVAPAMLSRLARHGISPEETQGEDPVAFFDAFFRLKGSREGAKPLKLWFAHRIRAEGIAMRDFVCGTLFGSASGRVHDIVVDWIAALKGWRPRTLRDADGRRRLVWEGAAEEDAAAALRAGDAPPDDPDFLDEAPMRREIAGALARTAARLGVEKPAVALLLYATAQDVPLTDAAVLEGLKTGKSRAYALREKVVKRIGAELADAEGAGSPLFGRLLLEVCEAAVPAAVRAQLEKQP